MAASQLANGKILARDLAAYTDGELDQYLEAHSTEGGPTVVEVADPENLSSGFIQRLRDRAQRTSIATQSHAVDLDQVTARLLQATVARYASPQPPLTPSDGAASNTTTTTALSSPTDNGVRRFYDELVNDGGRPLFPVTLLDDVSDDPRAYKEMLRPWQDRLDAESPTWANVFQNQVGDWQEFRDWQKYNRSEGPPVIRRRGPSAAAYKAFRRHFRDNPSNYTEALGNLLAQYGFVRPFHLQDNAADQNELTTWIEYLGYSCATHYQCREHVTLLQPKHDEAWRTLVDSGVLRAFETREYLDDPKSAHLHASEAKQAQKAVEAAESAVEAAGKRSCGTPSEACALELSTSQAKLKAALTHLEFVKRRNSLVTEFIGSVHSHRTARTAERLSYIRMQWILEQVPLVEAETKEVEATGANSNTQTSTSKSGGEQEAESRHKRPRGKSKDQPAKSPLAGGSVSHPAKTRNAHKRTRLDNTEDVERRSKRVRKTLDGGITETTTPRGSPITSRATRSRQPAPTPPKPASSAPKSKQRTRPPAVSDSGVAPRRSRRLIGDRPEFGLLKERRGATPVEEPVQRSSGAVPKSRAPPANAPRTKGTKTAASKQAGTARKKRRAK